LVLVILLLDSYLSPHHSNLVLLLCVDSYSAFPYSPPAKAMNLKHYGVRRIITQEHSNRSIIVQ